MSEAEAKVIEKQNLNSMPTLTAGSETGVPTDLPTDLPTEVVLAILFSQAKKLEAKALAQILTGTTPKGETVTYIRMTGVKLDKENGFALATRESVGTQG